MICTVSQLQYLQAFVSNGLCVFSGNGAGYSVGLHGANIQSALQAGLVVFPAWAQSQRILEIAAITAFIEAVCQEVSAVVEVSFTRNCSCLLLLLDMQCCALLD